MCTLAHYAIEEESVRSVLFDCSMFVQIEVAPFNYVYMYMCIGDSWRMNAVGW